MPPSFLPALGLIALAGRTPLEDPAWASTVRTTPAETPAADLAVDLLDGGDFDIAYDGPDPLRRALVPWWRAEPRASAVPLEVVERDGALWLVTPPGRAASQPVAGYAPRLCASDPDGSGAGPARFEVRGRVRGRGLVTLSDGAGTSQHFDVGAAGAETSFELTDFAFPLQPRLELRLAAAGDAPACWTALHALVPLPAPSAAELRAEVVQRLDEIVELWLGRGLDPATGMLARHHDAVTGQSLYALQGGVHPLWIGLLEASRYEDRPAWRAAFETFLATYLQDGFAEETGVPLRWNFASGTRELDATLEIHLDLGFLLDVADHGPERFRTRALERALALGETVLAHGVLPDGNVAAAYRARDAEPSLNVNPLRRFDVPAQLARIGAITGDERFVDAARRAVAAWEYAHLWPCTWDAIDPGFDDEFGHYAGDAVTMLALHPGDPAFRRIVRSGYDYYAPRWHDALRFGGPIAADQVRCWKLLLEFAELEPEVAPEIHALLPLAVRTHFKGEQYANGAWGDVTFENFDPRTIEVGDLPGTPANLLEGLALAHDPKLAAGFAGGLAEVRALYAAVLRSTVASYRRPYGYLVSRERTDVNRAGGGLRMLAGLTAMLARL